MLLEEDPTTVLENRLENSTVLFLVSPSVWADGNPGRAKSSELIKIRLKEGASTPWKRQYPLKKEALKGIQPLIQKFKDLGLIQPCLSPYKSPILPVQKPKSQECHFVQDLWAINGLTEDSHPMVPKACTL